MAAHSDFSIGVFFRCAEELWRCTDVGTRTVVAVQWTNTYLRMRSADTGQEYALLGPFDLRREKQDWTKGPPYLLAEQVFDENDFSAMELVPAEPGSWPMGS
jgi:hypothetical protein